MTADDTGWSSIMFISWIGPSMKTYLICCFIVLNSFVEVYSEKKEVHRGEVVPLFRNVRADNPYNEVNLYINGARKNTLIITWTIENEIITMKSKTYHNIFMDVNRTIWIYTVDETYDGTYSLLNSSIPAIELTVLGSRQVVSDNTTHNNQFLAIIILATILSLVVLIVLAGVALKKKWPKRIRASLRCRHEGHGTAEEMKELSGAGKDGKLRDEEVKKSLSLKTSSENVEEEPKMLKTKGSMEELEKIQLETIGEKEKLEGRDGKPLDEEGNINTLSLKASSEKIEVDPKKLKTEITKEDLQIIPQETTRKQQKKEASEEVIGERDTRNRTMLDGIVYINEFDEESVPATTDINERLERLEEENKKRNQKKKEKAFLKQKLKTAKERNKRLEASEEVMEEQDARNRTMLDMSVYKRPTDEKCHLDTSDIFAELQEVKRENENLRRTIEIQFLKQKLQVAKEENERMKAYIQNSNNGTMDMQNVNMNSDIDRTVSNSRSMPLEKNQFIYFHSHSFNPGITNSTSANSRIMPLNMRSSSDTSLFPTSHDEDNNNAISVSYY